MARAALRLAHVLRSISPPLATGVGYYLAAAVALLLSRGDEEIATLWPSSGILFAALLVAPRHRAGWHIGAAAVGSLAANLGSGNAMIPSIGYTVANVAESVVAAWLLKRRGRGRVSFASPTGLVWFVLAALSGTIASATIAVNVTPAPSVGFWFSWISTDFLGALVVTPILLIIGRAFHPNRRRAELKPMLEVTATFCLVALVTALSFWQSSYPLLFLPMLAVIVAAFRLGQLGAAGGVLIVAFFSSLAIRVGLGPPALVAAGSLARNLFLQFYLLTLFAAALPIAALLAMRGRLMDQLAEKMRLLQLAESAAHVGHWRFDTVTETITWSPEVFRIHGIDGSALPSLKDAIEAYYPDDRAIVTAHLERSIELREAFEFTARIVRPDGEIRHVFSRGEIDHFVDGGSLGLFGMIQDITAQVAHEAAIEDARIHAEAAAKEAMILAETDQLTGIANRRCTVAALQQAVITSRKMARPVSVAVFDIDHFKRINDTYGHPAGDEVLKRVAGDAARELRSGDTIGRFGGEEFVIVLPDATASTALLVAERVRTAIEAGGSKIVVTISIGVAELAIDETCETLLKRADHALYEAKNEGRNTLRLAA